ncbi:MAG TPA: hypothetical protein VGO58_08995 [Chitinophagaceae bacterium]|nr:hypothetical protein [Chitinophagaceae bacterium]
MKSILRKARITGPAIAIIFALLCSEPVAAQSPVVQFMANYITAASPVNSYTAFPTSPGTFSLCNTNNYTYTWSNGTSNQLKLASFTANSKTYIISGTPGVLVKLRRVNNLNVTGNRNILYSESTFATATSCVSAPRQLDFKVPYSDEMTTFLNNNVLNHGTDNIFTNAGNGDGNNNNIERVDVVFTTGISSALPSDMGFILCERGNNNAHDGFRIAAILSKNAGNDPTSFGAVRNCTAGNGTSNGSWGHPSIANGNKQLAAYILRKDAAEPYLRVSSNVNQELGGVFFSLTDLGVAANQIIYGYSLIAPDGIANPSSAQLLNTSDITVYPTITTEAAGGGLDLIAVNTFFGTNQALASSLITNFNGSTHSGDVILNWKLNSIANGTRISLERSVDAVSFSPIHNYTYDGNSTGSFSDKPGQGRFYYRLVIETEAGSKIVSAVIQFKIENNGGGFRIYPTIIRPGGSLTLENLATGLYTAVLRNGISCTVYRTVLNARNGKANINLPAKQLSPGIYYLALEKDGGQVFGRERIIISK